VSDLVQRLRLDEDNLWIIDKDKLEAADRIEALEAEAEEQDRQIYAAMVDAVALIKMQGGRVEALEAVLRKILAGHPDAFDLARTALAPEQDK